MDPLKRLVVFPGFSVRVVLVNPFLRFTKPTNFLLKSLVLRAGVLKRLLTLTSEKTDSFEELRMCLKHSNTICILLSKSCVLIGGMVLLQSEPPPPPQKKAENWCRATIVEVSKNIFDAFCPARKILHFPNVPCTQTGFPTSCQVRF